MEDINLDNQRRSHHRTMACYLVATKKQTKACNDYFFCCFFLSVILCHKFIKRKNLIISSHFLFLKACMCSLLVFPLVFFFTLSLEKLLFFFEKTERKKLKK